MPQTNSSAPTPSKFSMLMREESNRATVQKLGYTTLIMFSAPILAFYVSSQYIFYNREFPDAWAGIVAVIVTNVVVVGYVVSAFQEEEDEPQSAPKTGFNRIPAKKKERVD